MTTVDIAEFIPLLPEIFVLSMACIILIVDLYLSDETRNVNYYLSILTLAVAAGLTYVMAPSSPQVVLSGAFVSDSLSVILKIFIYLVTIGVFIYSRQYLEARGLFKGEFFILALFAVLGMMVLASSHNMISVYLGLELLSLALYAMVAINRDSLISTEAAMKYFVLGALASGLLLYGMSMLYGASGSLDLAQISTYIKTHPERDTVLLLGLVFTVVGLAFKLGAVPFHMWVPDVYDGAPTASTLFIGTAPKLAGLAMIMRMLVDGLGGLHNDWSGLLVILAVLSLAVGNVVAIAQTSIKRMLAYSTISHMGFLFLGILSATPEGYAAALYYTIAYTIMSLGGFGMILLLSRTGFEADQINDFKGLNDRSPWFAFMMLILMISMAGIPPVLGFYAKLSVLQAAVAAGYTWLAVYAVIFSIVGAFYYLRIIKVMYFDRAEEVQPIVAHGDMRTAMSLNGIGVLLLGIFPSGLLALCASALS